MDSFSTEADRRHRWLRATGLAFASLLLLSLSLFETGSAGASTQSLEPCPKPPAAKRFEGEATVVLSSRAKKVLGAHGLRQKLISPANAFTGRPTYPVRNAGLAGRTSRVWLDGAFRLGNQGGRDVRVSRMRLVVGDGRVSAVKAKVAGKKMRLFRITGAKLKTDLKSGVLDLRGGEVRLSGKASKRIRARLGLRGERRLESGRVWGRISVFAARNKKVEDPEAETPVEPPFLERPLGATDVTAASIKWRVRESFIRYVAVGAGTSVADGASADPAEAIGNTAPLTYSFNFPFDAGWTSAGPGPAAIHGAGKVGFRYCTNTINFTVADPEIELNGDSDSRLIFRVDGTDGTAFPDSRAVMVQLIPSLATSTTEGNTTTLTDIPGYIPQAATGVFADFYPPFPGSVDAAGADLSRFGSLTVSYTTG
jgi:hypothetical protein